VAQVLERLPSQCKALTSKLEGRLFGKRTGASRDQEERQERAICVCVGGVWIQSYAYKNVNEIHYFVQLIYNNKKGKEVYNTTK
jgi:hypothetical protein